MSGEGEAAEERRGGQPGGWDLEDQENTSGVTLSETGAIAGAGARVRHDGIEAEPRGGCSEQRWRPSPSLPIFYSDDLLELTQL